MYSNAHLHPLLYIVEKSMEMFMFISPIPLLVTRNSYNISLKSVSDGKF